MAIWPSRSGLLLVWSVGRGEALVVVVLEAVRGRAVIGSLSLGVTREFRVRRILPKEKDKDTEEKKTFPPNPNPTRPVDPSM